MTDERHDRHSPIRKSTTKASKRFTHIEVKIAARMKDHYCGVEFDSIALEVLPSRLSDVLFLTNYQTETVGSTMKMMKDNATRVEEFSTKITRRMILPGRESR